MRTKCCVLVVFLSYLAGCSHTPVANSSVQAIDRDLMEVTVPRLKQFYATHKYTVTDVVRWYMARIGKYNGIYRAVQTLDATGALAIAAQEDADAKSGGASFFRGPL